MSHRPIHLIRAERYEDTTRNAKNNVDYANPDRKNPEPEIMPQPALVVQCWDAFFALLSFAFHFPLLLS